MIAKLPNYNNYQGNNHVYGGWELCPTITAEQGKGLPPLVLVEVHE